MANGGRVYPRASTKGRAHMTSSELRPPQVKEYDIMPAGEAPGRDDYDDEYYDE